jgi:hypothetical protein
MSDHEFSCVYASSWFLFSVMYGTKILAHVLYNRTSASQAGNVALWVLAAEGSRIDGILERCGI